MTFQQQNEGHYGAKGLSLVHSRVSEGNYTTAANLAAETAQLHNANMNSPTREEIDAKLETIDAKMDGRLARIEDKFQSLLQSNQHMRNAIWGATAVTVGSVLAALALMVSSFDAGRETSKMASEAQARANEALTQTQAAVKEIRGIAEELKSLRNAAPTSPTPPPVEPGRP